MRQPAQPAPSPFVLRPVCLAVCLLGLPAAYALPQGGTPTFGQTDIRQTAPGQLLINQGTARAGIDWTSFSISTGERVQIVQPGRDSVLVNRVVGNDPSSIFGQLQSNGNVWLVNPRGIFFGASSRIDVGGLVATTLNLEGSGAEGGRLRLGRGSEGAGEIRAEGQITAHGGTVALVAPQVTQNGSIEAQRIGIAAATQVEVDVEGDGLVFFNARNDGSLPARLSLLGNVTADGGTADLRAAARAGFADTVLNLEGVVRARSIGQRNGRVFIDGGSDGAVIVSGTVDASGARAGERGGDVTITGDKVGLTSGSRVDASGDSGGGRIRVGGGFHGADADMRNASIAVVQRGATLNADAGQRGDGGQVVVWSDRSTAFAGDIQARGGTQGGDGGQAEVSSKGYLEFRGRSDLTAVRGHIGTLLLDPEFLEVVADGSQTLNLVPSGTDPLTIAFGDPPDPGTSAISASQLATTLETNDVILQATKDISVLSPFTVGAGTRTLTLQANRDIKITAGFTLLGNLSLQADFDADGVGAVTVDTGANLTAAGRTIEIHGGSASANAIHATVTAGTLQLSGTTSMTGSGVIDAANLQVKSGTLTLNSGGSLAGTPNVAVDDGATLLLPNAAFTIGLLSGGGTVTLDNGGAARLTVGAAGDSTFGGSIGGGNASGPTLTKVGSGKLTLTGDSTYAGDTVISQGTLEVGAGGATGSLLATSDVKIADNAVFAINRDNSAVVVINNKITDQTGADHGKLSVTGGATVQLGGANNYSGGTTVSGTSTLEIDATSRIDSGTLTLNGGTLSIKTGGDYTLGTKVNISLGSGGGTLNDNGNNGTVAGIVSGAGAFTKSGNGTLTFDETTASVNYGGNTRVSAGRLVLNTATNLADSSLVTVDAGATLKLAKDDTVGGLSLAGTLDKTNPTDKLTASTYTLAAGADAVANLGGGSLTASGNATLAGTSDATTVTVNNGATLTLGSANRLADTAAVTVNGTLKLNGDDTVGSLTLAGTLDKTGGADKLTAATYALTGAATQVIANLGAGTVNSSGSGVTLSGTADATTVNVTAGLLTLGSADRLADGAALNVSGGTLKLNGNETVATLSLAGTLDKTGPTDKLTASTYTLATGANALANLGAGSLTATGNATLAGTSDATTVTVNNGATLTLGSADRLADTAAVTVNGTLKLNGDDTVGSLTLAGTLDKTGGADKLTAATYALTGAATQVTANLGTGTLNSSGSGVTLGGTADAGTVNVTAGLLTLGSAERLVDGAAVNVNGGTLKLNGNETVGTLTLAGTLDKTNPGDKISAGTITLAAGANVLANLGSGALVVAADTTLNPTSEASSVTVNNGVTLTLGSADRLADTAAVTVNGTLKLNGNETVGSLSLTGTLDKTGATDKLSAGTTALGTGANVLANLGSGSLTVSGNATLAGTSDATAVTVNAGATLTLGSANRLADAADVIVKGTLKLNGSDTVGSLSLTGTLDKTGATDQLNAGPTTLGTGANVLANLGSGSLTVAGNATLAGTSDSAAVDIANGGNLTLGSAGRLIGNPTIVVHGGGTLKLGGNEITTGTATLGGTLDKTGINDALTASTYTLSGGTVNANLGTGNLNVTGSVTLSGSSGATNVTVDTTGNLTLAATGQLSGSAGLTVNSGGTLTLNGSQTVGTLSSAGTINATNAADKLTAGSYTLGGGTVNAKLGSGNLNVTGSATLAGTSDSAAINIANGGTLTLSASNQLVNANAAVTLADGATLAMSADQTSGSLSGHGTVNLGGATLITGSAASSTFSGTITSVGATGGLTKIGDGTTLTLAGSITYAGTTTVSHGTLLMDAAGQLGSTSKLFVDNHGALTLNGDETVGTATLSGTLNKTGAVDKLTADSYTLGGGTVNANLGTGNLNVTGSATLAGTSDSAAVGIANGATLTLAATGQLSGSAALTVNSGGTLTLNGSQSVGTLTSAGTINATNATDKLSAGSYTLGGGKVNAKLGAGNLSVTGDATLAGTSDSTSVGIANGGHLTLASAERLNDGATLRLLGGTARLTLTGDETVTSAELAGAVDGSGRLLAGQVELKGANVGVGVGLAGVGGTGGELRVSAGANQLSGSSEQSTVVVKSGATLTLVGDERLADAAVVTVEAGATLTLGGDEKVFKFDVAGTLSGGKASADEYVLAGGVFDSSLTGNRLTNTGDSLLNGSSNATIVKVSSGTLTLGSANRLTQAPDVNIAGGATLALLGNETVGSLEGSGTLALGVSTLATGSRQSSAFAGAVSGSGTLRVTANTLTLAPGASLDRNSSLQVDGGATLALGIDGTVNSATIAGTLAGAATLTADRVTLQGGTVSANLGPGTLQSSGDSRLDGLAAVGSVDVVGSGTLTLGTGGRLTAGPAVSVASGTTLALGGNETFDTLAGLGAVNLGNAVLTVGSRNGSSAFQGIASGSGSLVKQGSGTFTLGGANDFTGGTTVAGGTLALALPERLADSGSLTVTPGATLALGGTETLAGATVAGTLGGIGTLSAPTVTLSGGSVGANAALNTTTLHSNGNSRLNGSATTGALFVDDGTLTLGSAHRLAGSSAVTVATGSQLVLGGDETLATLAGGGSVDLGGATLSTGIADSTFSGTLGGGSLVKQGGGTFTLSGRNTFTGSTRVQAGTLALAADDVLADATDVIVASGATLAVAGRDTVHGLALAGTLGGSGTLTATAGYALADGANVNGNLGAGTLTSNGAVALNGTAATGNLQVQSGTLALGSPGRLIGNPTVDVASGATLQLGGNETTTGAVTLGGTLDRRNGGDTLVAGSLTANGTDARLVAALESDSVTVGSGRLTLSGANRLTATAAVTVAGGATLALNGDETLGTLAGSGAVDLGSATLSTGSGGNATFAGSIGGSGGLTKLGGGNFVLSGSSTYTGSTRVDAGTLELADGGTLANTSGYAVDGTLRFTHADKLTLTAPISGSGALEQAGSGVLTLGGPANTYSGTTRVLAGTLKTADSGLLPAASAVTVATGATLQLAGAETVASIDADGHVQLGGDLTTAGAMNLKGDVKVDGGRAIALTAARIDALNDANVWGSRLSLNSSGPVALSAGRVDGDPAKPLRDLTLGELNLGSGGEVKAGLIDLNGLSRLAGGTLTLTSDALPTGLAPDAALQGKAAPGGRQIGFASDAVTQTGGRIELAGGAQLSIVSANGGSISLLADDNQFTGGLSVRSGGSVTAWKANELPVGGQTLAVQSRVQVAGGTVNIGGAGIEADVVTIRADRLSTAPGAVIAARLPFDNRVGTADSLPGLTLELTPVAFGQPFPFGQRGAEIAVSVGSRDWGASTLPIDGGYLRVLPRHGASGATAVVLTGPQVGGSYAFFFDGAGQSGEIPVFYNGLLPLTPEISGSLSATLAVSEGARRERFDESVRTENVAVRLRAGVIAEVGPGRPATVGSEGIRAPAACAPAGSSLACEAN